MNFGKSLNHSTTKSRYHGISAWGSMSRVAHAFAAQGLQLFTALRRNGVPSQALVFSDEGHGG
jgi:hypothetical protein